MRCWCITLYCWVGSNLKAPHPQEVQPPTFRRKSWRAQVIRDRTKTDNTRVEYDWFILLIVFLFLKV